MDGEPSRKIQIQYIKRPSGGPYGEVAQKAQLGLVSSAQSRKFEVRCDAGDAGHLAVASDSVSVQIGQRVRKEGKEEFWGSVLVECTERDGLLAVEVIVFHPNWDEPVRVASIQSNPSDANAPGPTLSCDFEQRRL